LLCAAVLAGCGLVVPPESPAALRRLADDAPLRERLGAAARASLLMRESMAVFTRHFSFFGKIAGCVWWGKLTSRETVLA